MDHNHDFSSLRELLALARHDLPRDTQLDEFLTEFHCRQRAQLLEPKSMLSRCGAWMRERMGRLEWAPSLSYAGVAAVIALTAFLGLSQQVAVTSSDAPSRFSFRMPIHEASFAMVPGSVFSVATLSPKLNDSPNFAGVRADAAATRYVLANNSPGANDATVAF